MLHPSDHEVLDLLGRLAFAYRGLCYLGDGITGPFPIPREFTSIDLRVCHGVIGHKLGSTGLSFTVRNLIYGQLLHGNASQLVECNRCHIVCCDGRIEGQGETLTRREYNTYRCNTGSYRRDEYVLEFYRLYDYILYDPKICSVLILLCALLCKSLLTKNCDCKQLIDTLKKKLVNEIVNQLLAIAVLESVCCSRRPNLYSVLYHYCWSTTCAALISSPVCSDCDDMMINYPPSALSLITILLCVDQRHQAAHMEKCYWSISGDYLCVGDRLNFYLLASA